MDNSLDARTGVVGPLQRGTMLLRLLATASARGIALTDLSAKTGLPHSTVHRLLVTLIREGLAVQLEDTRSYALGQLAFELGLAAAQRFDARSVFRPVLERLSDESGDTAYVHVRSGFEAVCLDMVEGTAAIRVVPLRIGSRRPLGLGAGGLAILAALGEADRDDVLSHVAPYIEREWKFPQHSVRASVDETRRQGYALIRNRVTPGVTAIGVPYSDSLGRVAGALTIASINEQMDAPRVSSLHALLKHAVKQVEKSLRGGRSFDRTSQGALRLQG